MTAIPTPQPLRLLDRPLVRVEVGALLLLVAGAFPQPARAMVAVPALLLLPGYATVVALRLNAAKQSDSAQTMLMSLVASMAVIPILLLGLHGVGMPLVSGAILPVLAGYCCVAALLGGRRAARPQAADGTLIATGGRIVAVALLAAMIIGVGLRTLPGTPDARYTSLALGGTWSQVSTPTFAPAGKPTGVTVTVANHSDAAKRYLLEPAMDGGTWKSRTITVAAGATWTGDVTGTVPAGGCLHRLLVGLSSKNDRIGGLTVWFQSRRTLPDSCQTGERDR
ncbi:MAG: hypothetical protein QOJ13_3583 [Gaiellales bacterium]|jgi:uncharacterized membrane protein|nr:hypothetical protein [Gaiellales bacterium]